MWECVCEHMCVCVCVIWHWMWNTACHVLLQQPPFKWCMMSTHTPTHFLYTHPQFSALTCAIPSFLPSFPESFPLSKSFFFQLFFLIGSHTALRHPEQTDVCYAIRIRTRETLVQRECCYTKCSKQSSTQLHSYYFTASLQQIHFICSWTGYTMS